MKNHIDGYIERVRSQCIDEYSKNDDAHQIDHADAVCKNALYIIDKLKLDINKKMVVATAYIHDLKCHVNRSTHHVLASLHIKYGKDPIINEFSSTDKLIMANAILKHRSSYKFDRGNVLERVIAMADIGPVNLEEIICRSYKYHSSKNDTSDPIQAIYDHLQDKFSSTGYRKYGDLYMEVYGEIVKDFKEEVDNITYKQIEEVISRAG